MANESDSFIDEVTEEVRRDRLFAAFRKYGWIGLVVILAIVGGAAFREYSQAQDRAAAEAWGNAVIEAESQDDPVAALAALDPQGSEGRAVLAKLLAAGHATARGDEDRALGLLEDAAASAEQDAILGDLARLKMVMAAGDVMNPATRDTILADLSRPGAPFRLLALEQKAIALIAAGRRDDAVTLIREIQKQDGISPPLQQRLAEMMIVLGENLPAGGAADDVIPAQ